MRGSLLLVVWLGSCATSPAPAPAPAPSTPTTPPQLSRVATDVTAFVKRQLLAQQIPGIWVAVLDVDPADHVERTWSYACMQSGYPQAWHPFELLSNDTKDPAIEPAPIDATHRVASISKLFTDTALMVLVERGQLDLDAPVTRYLPDFHPHNPFGTAITLRHLMGHRAGLVREPPVGHYFDPSQPTLAATVASLNDTELVAEPGSAYKYSNPGIGVVGEIVARTMHEPFADAVRELVLTPLGLHDSDFAPREDLVARQAKGIMWTYDGRDIPTPQFAFGYSPAADLRSTVADLVHFARSWFPDATRRVLRPETQAAMWQLPAGETTGCGIGFFLSQLDGQRVVGHNGAVYGFASSIRAMPEQGLAVAVVCTKDFANAVATAIAERALRAAFANRRGEALTPAAEPVPLGRELARKLAGCWRVGANWVELTARDGDLYYDPNIGVRTRLRIAAGGAFVSDDTLSMGSRKLTMLENGHLHDGAEDYVRDDTMPAAPPDELLPLLGEYGWDHDVLVVYEDHGRLGVLIEWVVRDLPARLDADHYRFNPGMYDNDRLDFERDAAGHVVAAVVGGARFVRRPDPTPGGYRIKPVRPIGELVREAASQQPPHEGGELRASELVELASLDPTLRFDLKYASADNFLGTPVYPPGARAKMQRPAAEALVRVQRALATQGLGLLVYDAYRPWSVTKVFWDATPAAQHEFVADPSRGSRHNRGCAVDLTLCELATGTPVPMPSDFDEFTPRAYPDYPGGTSQQRHYRELLRGAMEQAGFTVYEREWWHFDFADWARYAVGNEPLTTTR